MGIASASNELESDTIKYIEKDSGNSSETDPSINVEKGEVVTYTQPGTDDEDVTFMSSDDPFPIDPDEIPEPQQFTVRAVLVGCILGAVIAASKYVSTALAFDCLTNSMPVSISV